jgi:hypothetical protein
MDARYYAMPNAEHPIAVGRVVLDTDHAGRQTLTCARFAPGDRDWVQAPSVYRLYYDAEGGDIIDEDTALRLVNLYRH